MRQRQAGSMLHTFLYIFYISLCYIHFSFVEHQLSGYSIDCFVHFFVFSSSGNRHSLYSVITR